MAFTRSFFFLMLVLSLFINERAISQNSTEDVLIRYTTAAGKTLQRYFKSYDIARAKIILDFGEDAVPKLHAGSAYQGGWAFSFGFLENDTTYVLKFGVRIDDKYQIAVFQGYEERKLASPLHTRIAMGMNVMQNEFSDTKEEAGFNHDPYRFAILSFPRGEYTGFVAPEQSIPGFTITGQEIMYSMKRSDLKIYQKTGYRYKALPLPLEYPGEAIASLLAPDTYFPSPLDVVHAINRKAPLFVQVRAGFFMIHPDGSIEKLPDDHPLVEATKNK